MNRTGTVGLQLFLGPRGMCIGFRRIDEDGSINTDVVHPRRCWGMIRTHSLLRTLETNRERRECGSTNERRQSGERWEL